MAKMTALVGNSLETAESEEVLISRDDDGNIVITRFYGSEIQKVLVLDIDDLVKYLVADEYEFPQ